MLQTTVLWRGSPSRSQPVTSMERVGIRKQVVKLGTDLHTEVPISTFQGRLEYVGLSVNGPTMTHHQGVASHGRTLNSKTKLQRVLTGSCSSCTKSWPHDPFGRSSGGPLRPAPTSSITRNFVAWAHEIRYPLGTSRGRRFVPLGHFFHLLTVPPAASTSSCYPIAVPPKFQR